MLNTLPFARVESPLSIRITMRPTHGPTRSSYNLRPLATRLCTQSFTLHDGSAHFHGVNTAVQPSFFKRIRMRPTHGPTLRVTVTVGHGRVCNLLPPACAMPSKCPMIHGAGPVARGRGSGGGGGHAAAGGAGLPEGAARKGTVYSCSPLWRVPAAAVS